MKQITNSILMIRPVAFRMNEQTAVNNYFQKKTSDLEATINIRAQEEFDNFVDKLRAVGVHVIVVDDDKNLNIPDSIFPNNWISFHQNGDIALYPMFAENRRPERRQEIIEAIEKDGFQIKNIVDYTSAEDEGVFLEGTGNLILDRANQKAYCALSPRAHEDLCIEFCEDFEFTPVLFKAYQTVNDQRLPIYHTNVMMCLAEEFAIVCLASIDDKKEKKTVIKALKQDGKEIIDITEDQMHQFAGNMLQVQGDKDKYLVMSESAFKSLTEAQIKTIERTSKILYADLHTIETHGGGSARCMLAEIFNPKA
ncbi:MAG: citrulline utilization hydrolase CtlX [Psychroflexus halocasei]|uniref:citrulline utilization hydrolase CtlX n=1 Tax=Psychroflexus sp. S27 TaxID=1982757 RepID=UPI000C2AF2CE|nr:arginine deiminase-related protein [Psychroflexus sp. S27]PJX24056.1 amidinotransferase [Psychroflexus sp. S27]